MKKLVIGILAHVDAGKTTLSEALLYHCGAIQALGRVDHQTAFLDHFALERERGITIFSKQAMLAWEDLELTLLDTPGHMDFSAEMERCLQVLDYAILVVSGTDGVQSHTHTLWNLLRRYQVPTFLFVNKMDLDSANQTRLLHDLKRLLDDNCLPFDDPAPADWLEQVALCDEAVMSSYLDSSAISDQEIATLIQQRKLFPCYFGSALKLQGVDRLLDGVRRYAQAPAYPEAFGARVYKIARDAQGSRLTYLKLTGGRLKVKDTVPTADGSVEKVDQIRLYSGAKYQSVQEAEAGMVCAVTGLEHTFPGQGLGYEPPLLAPELEPVMTYQLVLPEGQDPHLALASLKLLEEEDPLLRILWNDMLKEIHIQLMGDIQLEILRQLILDRFQMEVTFDAGSIIYKETIASPVEGVGHFEPLRHYAEVHLLLEPTPPGSGLQFGTTCSTDMLHPSWQRLILTHLQEKVHLGVLTGSAVTDLSITLVSGKAHPKHTEGGDFREATYRAVRQGLACAESILLEPWYAFRLELPPESVGRAMSDIQQMGGRFSAPATQGSFSLLEGTAPISAMGNYAQDVSSYTRGQGRLFCSLDGYRPCPNQEAVVAAIGYEPEHDLENPAGSIFCTHGAGFTVKWDQVKDYMHLPFASTERPVESACQPASKPRSAPPISSLEQDKELMAIYERTYGAVKRHGFLSQDTVSAHEKSKAPQLSYQSPGPEYLLVDGYNIIHSWDELKGLAEDNLDAARKRLMDLLSNYQGVRQCNLILVFDAYKVPGNVGEVSNYHNIYVVYTKEAETADAYIEKTTYELGKTHRVRVATSDNAEQLIILGHGALRMSAKAFYAEVQQVNQQIQQVIAQQKRSSRSQAMEAALRSALEQQDRE